MKFSLVLATYGRKEELDRFFFSLSQQTYKNFEVILCDQNPEGFLEDVLKKYALTFQIVHLKTPKGLSISRNEGLKVISGEVVSFPDDDCVYSENLLDEVAKYFKKESIDGISCKAASLDKGNIRPKFFEKRTEVTKDNVFFTVTSWTLFLKRKIVEEIGSFNPLLGVGSGSPFGSGEEIDFVLRALEKGFRIRYFPELVVYHPSKDPALSGYRREDFERAISYNRGFMYLLVKHRYGIKTLARAFIRPLGGSFLALLKGEWKKALLHLAVFRARVETFKILKGFKKCPDTSGVDKISKIE